MRFFNKKTLLLLATVVVVIVVSAIGGMLIYLSSPGFKENARQYAVREIEKRTGAHVSMGRLTWNIWTQKISIFDLTLRGLEPAETLPLAHFESIEAGVSVRALWNRKIDLFELTVTRPEFHMLVDEKGNTNLPSPPPSNPSGRAEYELSIRNFRVAQGMALINERQVSVDFTLKNLESILSYQGNTRILTAHTSYDGVLDREGQAPIPYTFSGDADYTRGTILAKHFVITSDRSQIQMQGRINDTLTSKIAGKLEYNGTALTPFMNYFFPAERFAGTAAIAGALEFSRGLFRTHGNVKAESIGFNGWTATAFSGDYDYRFPEKRMTVEHIAAHIFDGETEGTITVDPLPGTARTTLDLKYKNVDGAAMARAYPWDPKYRIQSRMTGQLQGWLEGRLEKYEFTGDAALASAEKPAEQGVLAFPLDGNLGYVIRPGTVSVSNANLHFLSTSIQADGSIDMGRSNLRVHMATSDLRNLSFLYADANGTGSFDGVLSGPIQTPVADGTFELRQHKYQQWVIEQASGSARVDTMAGTANLTNVRVVQGQSQITLSGATTLDGKKVDLRVQSTQVRAEDVAPFVKQKFGGVFSGAIHLTSLDPLRFDGDVRAIGLAMNGQTLDTVQSHVQYDDPSITLQNLMASDSGSTLAGRATYNTTTEAMTFTLRINSIDLKRLRTFGVPEALEGVVQQADLTGSGTRAHPEVNGSARLQNLSFDGEMFPTARLDVNTAGTRVSVKLSETRNLDLSAQIDTSNTSYPFTADAGFRRYSIERLAGFTRGTLVVTGNASLKGSLKDLGHISGTGRIDPVEINIQGEPLQSTKPFAFDFNSERLNISDVSLASSKGTQMTLGGTVGLMAGATVNLTLKGPIDAGLFASPEWKLGGTVNVQGQISGTLAKPDLRGQASFADLSVSRQGVSVSLTALKGDVVFDEHRVTFNNVEGHSNGGTIRLQGTGVIEGDSIGAVNILVDARGVRVRYAMGLRTIVDGSLVVGGNMNSPSISGELQIQSLAINSNFDDFLNLFDTGGAGAPPSPFGSARLSLHIAGNRNISIRNELASAEARVDLVIKGTVDNPALTGHVETNSGTLTFQGRKYDVTRGNVDFVDPMRIDPTVNIQAETTVRNYQVFLTITGKTNRLQLSMRSEPPLPQLEIVNLISGGKTTDELAQSASASSLPTGERVFQGGATSILSDMLVSRVGSKLNLLGIDQHVHIDPYVVGAQNNSTARITVSEQPTKDLSVTYSVDLATNKQQVIQIEYFITKNISILASKDENDVRALDLRIRRRF